ISWVARSTEHLVTSNSAINFFLRFHTIRSGLHGASCHNAPGADQAPCHTHCKDAEPWMLWVEM
ncbi:MAG: hypothetical protein ACUVXF_09525, partial [Desulfobaccales bacterium]